MAAVVLTTTETRAPLLRYGFKILPFVTSDSFTSIFFESDEKGWACYKAWRRWFHTWRASWWTAPGQCVWCSLPAASWNALGASRGPWNDTSRCTSPGAGPRWGWGMAGMKGIWKKIAQNKIEMTKKRHEKDEKASFGVNTRLQHVPTAKLQDLGSIRGHPRRQRIFI